MQQVPEVKFLSLYKNGDELAKPNYQYEKRQRDLAKKKKKEEKRLNKLKKKIQPAEGAADTPSDEGTD
jgi:chaperonin cofactor prefoldin